MPLKEKKRKKFPPMQRIHFWVSNDAKNYFDEVAKKNGGKVGRIYRQIIESAFEKN
jgi:hypothetical protein